jgi:hypothetical protein
VRAEVQRYGIDGVAISTDCLTGASETGPNALSSLGVDAHRSKDSSIVFHDKISLLLVTNNGTAILKMNQARQRLLFGSREAEIGFLCVIALTHSVQNGAQFDPLSAKRQQRFTGDIALGLDPIADAFEMKRALGGEGSSVEIG